MSRWCMRRSRL